MRVPKSSVPVRAGIALLTCLVFTLGHTLMTIVHVAPINPISIAVDPAVSAYMLPFFQQNWQLFAPEPINSENGILVRAAVRTDDGSETITEFYDLTSPTIQAIYASRLFPPRRTRLIVNIQQLLGYRDPLAQRLRETLSGDQDLSEDELYNAQLEVFPLTPGEQATHDLAFEMLHSMAIEAAMSQWGEGVTAIQVRLTTNRFPPFSERGSDERVGELTIADSTWLAVVE